jgi:hypothetical protein
VIDINADVVPLALRWYSEDLDPELREMVANLSLYNRYGQQRIAVESLEKKVRSDVAKAEIAAMKGLVSLHDQQQSRVRTLEADLFATTSEEALARAALQAFAATTWNHAERLFDRFADVTGAVASDYTAVMAAWQDDVLLPTIHVAERTARSAIEATCERRFAVFRRYLAATARLRWISTAFPTAPYAFVLPKRPRPDQRVLGAKAAGTTETPKTLAARRRKRALELTARDAAAHRVQLLAARRDVTAPSRRLARLVDQLYRGSNARRQLYAEFRNRIERGRAVTVLQRFFFTTRLRIEAKLRTAELREARRARDQRVASIEKCAVQWQIAVLCQSAMRAAMSTQQGSFRLQSRVGGAYAVIVRFARGVLARNKLSQRRVGFGLRAKAAERSELRAWAVTAIAARWRERVQSRVYRRQLKAMSTRRALDVVDETTRYSRIVVQSFARRVIQQARYRNLREQRSHASWLDERRQITAHACLVAQRVYRGHRVRVRVRHLRAELLRTKIMTLSQQLDRLTAAPSKDGAAMQPRVVSTSPARRLLTNLFARAGNTTAAADTSPSGPAADLLPPNSIEMRRSRLRQAVLASQQLNAPKPQTLAASEPLSLTPSPGKMDSPTSGAWKKLSRALKGSSAFGHALSRSGKRPTASATEQSLEELIPVASAAAMPSVSPITDRIAMVEVDASAQKQFVSIIGAIRLRRDAATVPRRKLPNPEHRALEIVSSPKPVVRQTSTRSLTHEASREIAAAAKPRPSSPYRAPPSVQRKPSQRTTRRVDPYSLAAVPEWSTGDHETVNRTLIHRLTTGPRVKTVEGTRLAASLASTESRNASAPASHVAGAAAALLKAVDRQRELTKR